MKNKIILVITLILVVVTISGYLVVDHFFPFAPPIPYPSIEYITSISISNDDMDSNTTVPDFVRIILSISNSKPTRKMSVNDFPSVRPYYRIEVLTDERMFNYYIFEENNKVYIELPYEGIYIVESEILEVISGSM